MGISQKSINQALEVRKIITDRNITVIHGKGTLHRIIECVKFPYLINKKQWDSKPHYDKRPCYMGQQYEPILYWLVDTGFLTETRDPNGWKYHYIVNK